MEGKFVNRHIQLFGIVCTVIIIIVRTDELSKLVMRKFDYEMVTNYICVSVRMLSLPTQQFINLQNIMRM